MKPDSWYSKNEIFHWLKHHDYSESIAEELSELISEKLKGAYKMGAESVSPPFGDRVHIDKLEEENQRLKEALTYALTHWGKAENLLLHQEFRDNARKLIEP